MLSPSFTGMMIIYFRFLLKEFNLKFWSAKVYRIFDKSKYLADFLFFLL